MKSSYLRVTASCVLGTLLAFPIAQADDSDGDGVHDAVELVDGTNPNLASDYKPFSLSLLARYAFDGDATDSSGAGANGTLYGSPQMIQGIRGQAIQFDGINDYFVRNPTPNNSLPFTWSLWVKVPATGYGTWISTIELGQTSQMTPALQIKPIDATHYQLSLYLWGGATGSTSTVQTCSDVTRWHHLALTNDAGGVRRLYFDGAEVLVFTSASFGQINSALYMGGHPTLGYYHTYCADEARVYHRALSVQEVTAMYANQSPPAPGIAVDLPSLMERASGSPVILSVTPSGIPDDFSYQWYFNNVAITAENGGQSATLNLTVGPSNAGNYHVRVTNSGGHKDSVLCLVAPSEDGDNDGLGDWRETNVIGTSPSLQDSDADGLLDGDEVNTHRTQPMDQDSDDDGYFDGYEVSKGTSPIIPESAPANQSRILTAVELRFSAALGQQYRIEASEGLDVWQTLESGIPGNGGEIRRFYSIENVPKRFLRVIKEQ